MSEHLLAIDAGTGSLPRGDVRPRGATRSRSASASTPTPPLPGVPGSQVFDTAANWQLICECIREALAAAGAHAVGGQALSARPACARAWCSTTRAAARYGPARTPTRARARRPPSSCARARRRRSTTRAGDWVAITAPARFRGSRATSPRSSPRSRTSACSATGSCTRLSGEFVTDPSLGSSSGMFELAERDWSERDPRDLSGSTAPVFPEVVEPGTVIGAVTAEAAAATGLREGTPVVAGGADTQLAPARHRRHPAGPLHRRRRQLLAAHGRSRRAARSTRDGAPADALPHRARPLDDGGDRLLLRDRDALVPRRLLRARERAGRARRRRRVRRARAEAAARAARARTASSGSSRT